jgi:hypothetical protein
MTVRRVPPEFDAADEVPEADAAEQHADVVDLTPGDDVPVESAEPFGDDDRVVALDDDEYR